VERHVLGLRDGVVLEGLRPEAEVGVADHLTAFGAEFLAQEKEGAARRREEPGRIRDPDDDRRLLDWIRGDACGRSHHGPGHEDHGDRCGVPFHSCLPSAAASTSSGD
jgi:hypothetical protein